MRDRRNTSLSVSSTSSSSSAASSSALTSFNEKRHSSPPPPSPSLPGPVTKANKPKAYPWKLMALKAFGTVCLFLLVWHFWYSWPLATITRGLKNGISPVSSGAVVEADPRSLEPMGSLVSMLGPGKWTVSIPHDLSFPLRSQQYQEICTKSQELQATLSKHSSTARWRQWRHKGSYYGMDTTFSDVAEAERSGLLPAYQPRSNANVCASSLTFAMDTNNASFGKTLLALWLSYGLAQKEGRAFFIDDTRWPYGKYTSYFVPPPSPDCALPPPHHIVPYPHQAGHLVVSTATIPWTFGPAFEEAFVNQRRHGLDRYQAIYDLIRKGYEDLFRLVGEDVLYAASRIAKMKDDADAHGGALVGMQIRRGDLRPYEFQFSNDYLPLERYCSGARTLFRSLLSRKIAREAGSDLDDFSAVTDFIHSPLVLASDDPDIFASHEMHQAAAPFVIQRAQERIHLATKAMLDKTSPAGSIRAPGSAYVKYVDENTGWEGGFYSALFYSLGSNQIRSRSGMLKKLDRLPDGSDEQIQEQALRIRELIGRAYLLDLAVLGESDGVVCAVSSAACRILGVMLGWDAVKEGRWMNVDDGRPWSWNGQR